ncbi:MAG: hypothetical protein AAF662_16870 [Pseudomonadota bacterium]
MNSTELPSTLFSLLDAELAAFDYQAEQSPKYGGAADFCRHYQAWTLAGARVDQKRLSVTTECKGRRIWVHHVAYNDFWTEEQLDHYYLLRDEIFPELMGLPASELNVLTEGHPARGVPIEELDKFSREELSAFLKRRLERWKGGELLGTSEQRNQRRLRQLRRFARGYGVPMALGSLVFLTIWRLTRRVPMTVKVRRLLFVAVGTLVFTPVPIPFQGWTTLGYVTMTGLVFVLLPMYLIEFAYVLSLPLSAVILFRLLSLRLITDPNQPGAT